MTTIAALDVHYSGTTAQVAVITFDGWLAVDALEEQIFTMNVPGEYEPGQFYKRELPCLMAAIRLLQQPPEIILIDGYVWLDAAQKPGLGGHLFAALEHQIPVVGVAKTSYKGSDFAVSLIRGESQNPLYVTAAGIGAQPAADAVASMGGPFRIPTLLKHVDTLSRIELET